MGEAVDFWICTISSHLCVKPPCVNSQKNELSCVVFCCGVSCRGCAKQLTVVEADIAKKSEREHRRQTDRYVYNAACSIIWYDATWCNAIWYNAICTIYYGGTYLGPTAVILLSVLCNKRAKKKEWRRSKKKSFFCFCFCFANGFYLAHVFCSYKQKQGARFCPQKPTFPVIWCDAIFNMAQCNMQYDTMQYHTSNMMQLEVLLAPIGSDSR